MTHFVNSHDSLVNEAIDGLIMASSGRLARLDGYPSIRVVTRLHRDLRRVAVISGGGSGHEPAHAGFVGEGLLDAAVCGDIFASPSVDAVLAAILSETGPAGCLLIVKNYTGDRLNFGLAAERARAMGIQVEMVIVGDDIALPNNPRPRGIAGTLFVHKAAGHAAASGFALADVRRAAEDVANAVKSIGVATTSCSIPGRAREDRIPEGHAELGLGIHGEPGIEHIALPAASKLVSNLIDRFGPDIHDAPRLALLLNNLGGVPDIEMSLITREILQSRVGRRIELVLGPVHAVTALDMRGFSISLMPLDDARAAMLTAPVAIGAWPTARWIDGGVTLRSLPNGLVSTVETPSNSPHTRQVLSVICEALIAAEADLNALDARVGDGDTGSTFAAAARRVMADLDSLPLADGAQLCRALADRLSRVMGGSSGVLLSIFAAATGVALDQGSSLQAALMSGVERLQHYGGAKLGDRTMLDALIPAIDAMKDGTVRSATMAARAGADATANMQQARAGRSSYVSSTDLAGVVDPGAEAVARVFEAIASTDVR